MEETKFKRPEFHLNEVRLIGRLCKDVELSRTQNDVPYAWVDIYVNTEQPGKDGKAGAIKEQFIKAQRWNCEKWVPYAKRNRKVLVIGRLEGYRKDGAIQMQLNIDRIEFLDTPGSTDNGRVDDPDLAEEFTNLQAYVGRLEATGMKQQSAYRELLAAYEAQQSELDALKAQPVKTPATAQKRAIAAAAAKGKRKHG